MQEVDIITKCPKNMRFDIISQKKNTICDISSQESYQSCAIFLLLESLRVFKQWRRWKFTFCSILCILGAKRRLWLHYCFWQQRCSHLNAWENNEKEPELVFCTRCVEFFSFWKGFIEFHMVFYFYKHLLKNLIYPPASVQVTSKWKSCHIS